MFNNNKIRFNLREKQKFNNKVIVMMPFFIEEDKILNNSKVVNVKIGYKFVASGNIYKTVFSRNAPNETTLGFYDPNTGDFGINRYLFGYLLDHGFTLSKSLQRLFAEIIVHNPKFLSNIFCSELPLSETVFRKKEFYNTHIYRYNSVNKDIYDMEEIYTILSFIDKKSKDYKLFITFLKSAHDFHKRSLLSEDKNKLKFKNKKSNNNGEDKNDDKKK